MQREHHPKNLKTVPAGNQNSLIKKASAQNGIASVQKNSPDDARYDRLEAKNGKPYFNLKAANHQIIGTSQFYSGDAARDNGIESVKKNGPSEKIKDLTEHS